MIVLQFHQQCNPDHIQESLIQKLHTLNKNNVLREWHIKMWVPDVSGHIKIVQSDTVEVSQVNFISDNEMSCLYLIEVNDIIKANLQTK